MSYTDEKKVEPIGHNARYVETKKCFDCFDKMTLAATVKRAGGSFIGLGLLSASGPVSLAS